MPLFFCVSKPGACTVMEYEPMQSGEKVYWPFSEVVLVCVVPVPSLVAVTVAFATTPPLGSRTVPRIVPVSTCPRRTDVNASRAGSMSRSAANLDIDIDEMPPWRNSLSGNGITEQDACQRTRGIKKLIARSGL